MLAAMLERARCPSKLRLSRQPLVFRLDSVSRVMRKHLIRGDENRGPGAVGWWLASSCAKDVELERLRARVSVCPGRLSEPVIAVSFRHLPLPEG